MATIAAFWEGSQRFPAELFAQLANSLYFSSVSILMYSALATQMSSSVSGRFGIRLAQVAQTAVILTVGLQFRDLGSETGARPWRRQKIFELRIPPHS